MTFQQFEIVLGNIFPGASVELDNDGQVVIYTNVTVQADGTLKEME